MEKMSGNKRDIKIKFGSDFDIQEFQQFLWENGATI